MVLLGMDPARGCLKLGGQVILQIASKQYAAFSKSSLWRSITSLAGVNADIDGSLQIRAAIIPCMHCSRIPFLLSAGVKVVCWRRTDGFASIASQSGDQTGIKMSSRRDWLLQQMGITQYTLRRPRALQGEIAVTLPAETRLLIVAECRPALEIR